jgi:hypothetical protein
MGRRLEAQQDATGTLQTPILSSFDVHQRVDRRRVGSGSKQVINAVAGMAVGS